MILETTNSDFMAILKNSVPKYSHLKVKLVDKDGQTFNRTLAWAAGGENIMMLGYRRKRYGSYINWDYFRFVIIPDKKEKTENDKWVRSWINVLNRLEKSGLWEEVASDVKTALDVGYDKIKQAYNIDNEYDNTLDYTENNKQQAIKIQAIDTRLVGSREDGTLYTDTSIVWYMNKEAKVKKMHFGKKWLNDKELADIANALENKLPIRVSTDGRWTGGYDVSYNYQPEDNKAWYREEYRGMGNGHYYLALDATHALFYEDD
jgi:hypothetical protein